MENLENTNPKIDNINSEEILNAENFKLLLDKKLESLFEERTSLLEFKLNADIQEMEIMKYEFYDNYKKFDLLVNPEIENNNTEKSVSGQTKGVDKEKGDDKKKTTPVTPINKSDRARTPVLEKSHAKKENLNRSAIVEGGKKHSVIAIKKGGDTSVNTRNNTPNNTPNPPHTTTNAGDKKTSVFTTKKQADARGRGNEGKAESNKTVMKTVAKDDSTLNNNTVSTKRGSVVIEKINPPMKRSSVVNVTARKGSVAKTDRDKPTTNNKRGSTIKTGNDKKISLKIDTTNLENSIVNTPDQNTTRNSVKNNENLSTNIKQVKIEETNPPQKEITGEVNEPTLISVPKPNYKPKTLPEDFEKQKNTIKALFISVNSNFLNCKLRFMLATAIPKIKANFNFKILIPDIIKEIQTKVNLIDDKYGKYLNDPEVLSKIKQNFIPSKTATNGLNFISKEDELNLWEKEQPEKILNIFKIIYLMLGEETDIEIDDLPGNKLTEHLITVIMPKLGINSLSKYINKIL